MKTPSRRLLTSLEGKAEIPRPVKTFLISRLRLNHQRASMEYLDWWPVWCVKNVLQATTLVYLSYLLRASIEYLNWWPVWCLVGFPVAVAGLNWTCQTAIVRRLAYKFGYLLGRHFPGTMKYLLFETAVGQFFVAEFGLRRPGIPR